MLYSKMVPIWKFVAILSFSFPSLIAYNPWEFNGTTPNLKNILLGRCSEFQEVGLTNRIPSLKVDVNCTEVWNLFKSIFSNKDPCKGTTDYKKLFEIINNKKNLNNKVRLQLHYVYIYIYIYIL